MSRAGSGIESTLMAKPTGLFPAGFSPPRAIDPIRAVDEAIRAVLAEMFGAARDGSRATRPPSEPAPVFADRLLGLRQAESLTPGTTIRVVAGTVITPLARELLKKKEVVVRLAGLADLPATAMGEWAFAIESGPGWLDALRRSLLEDAGRWRELDANVTAAIAWVGASAGRGAILVTADAAAAVWHGCRASGVRAAFAADPADVHRATETLGANLVVIDPAGKSIAWIRQLANAFRRAGAPRDPFAEGIGGMP